MRHRSWNNEYAARFLRNENKEEDHDFKRAQRNECIQKLNPIFSLNPRNDFIDTENEESPENQILLNKTLSQLEERLKGLTDEIEAAYVNVDSESEKEDINKNIDDINRVVSESYQALKDYKKVAQSEEGSSENSEEEAAFKKLTDSLTELEKVSNEVKGHPSRIWQGVGAALFAVGAIMASLAIASIVLSVLGLGLSLGGSSGGIALGIFVLSVSLGAMVIGANLVLRNTSQEISHKLRLFGDSVKECSKAMGPHQKTLGESVAQPFKTIYRNCFR